MKKQEQPHTVEEAFLNIPRYANLSSEWLAGKVNIMTLSKMKLTLEVCVHCHGLFYYIGFLSHSISYTALYVPLSLLFVERNISPTTLLLRTGVILSRQQFVP